MAVDLARFRYGIFDVDGTLLDRMSMYAEIFAELLAPFGIEPKEAREFFYNESGTPLPEQLKTILKKYNIEFSEEMIRDLVGKVLEKAEQKEDVVVFDGAKETLEKLATGDNPWKRKFKLFAFSGSRTRHLRMLLKKAGLSQFFVAILGSDRVPKGQMHIKIFSKISKRPFSIFVKESFLVSDGPGDIGLAKRCRIVNGKNVYGIYAIGIPNTVSVKKLIDAGANNIIHNLQELIGEENARD